MNKSIFQICDMITAHAKFYKVDEHFLHALVKVESNYNPLAVRFEPQFKWFYKIDELRVKLKVTRLTMKVIQATSFGICQIMGARAMEEGLTVLPTALIDPEVNLKMACKIINNIKSKYGEKEEDVYASYNQGHPGKVDGKYRNEKNVTRFMHALDAIRSKG